MSTDGTTRRTWAGTAVALTTAAWIAGVLTCLYLLFDRGMAAWAARSGDGTGTEGLRRDIAYLSVWLAAVAVGGPVLAAAFALAGRLIKTTVVYGVLAAVLMVPAVLIVEGASRDLHPAVEQPREPSGGCQEHSGGDTRCPGG